MSRRSKTKRTSNSTLLENLRLPDLQKQGSEGARERQTDSFSRQIPRQSSQVSERETPVPLTKKSAL